jgi:flagellar biosynthesis protein FliR
MINDLLAQFYLFILVFIRIVTVLVLIPIFGYEVIPLTLKLGLSVLLTFLVVPLLPATGIVEPQNIPMLFFAIGREVVAGLTIGLSTIFLFIAFQFAGTLIGIQIGFGIINVVDPLTEVEVSIIGQFINIVAMLLFLAIDGHFFLIQALVQSFNTIPLSGAIFSGKLVGKIVGLSSELFVITIKIGIPVILTLLLTETALGVLARTVPQMNIFIVGIPLKIGIGLFFLATSLPILKYVFNKLLISFENDVMTIIRLLGNS